MVKGIYFDDFEDLVFDIEDIDDEVSILADNTTIKKLMELFIKEDYRVETLDFDCGTDKHLLIVSEDSVINIIPFEDEDGCKWSFDDDEIIFVIDDLADEVQEDGNYVMFSIGNDETEITESDDGHYIYMNNTNTDKYGNTSMFSRSFYSSDKDLVDLMAKIWRG